MTDLYKMKIVISRSIKIVVVTQLIITNICTYYKISYITLTTWSLSNQVAPDHTASFKISK